MLKPIFSLLFVLLAFCLIAQAASAIDLGNGQFVFLGAVEKMPGKNTGYIIREGDVQYKLPAAKLKDFKTLSSTLAKLTGSEDLGARFSGTWLQNGNTRDLDPANLKVEIIRGEKDCPEKIFSSHNITGTFMGTDCGDFCYTTVKDKNGKDFTMYGDTEEVFGTKPGIKVSIEYETAQAWLDTGDWGTCVIADFFKSGKKLK